MVEKKRPLIKRLLLFGWLLRHPFLHGELPLEQFTSQAAMQAIRFDRSNSSGGNTRLQNLELGISNSGGNTSFSGNVSVTSAMGDISLGSTTMGFNYKTGDSGRSIDLYSTHVPTSFADSIRIGAATGINTASITTPSLMMHMAASNAILQLTDRQGKMNVGAVIDTLRGAWAVGKPLITRGRVVLGLAKETADRAQEQREISSASASGSNTTTGGGMGEGPEDSDEEGKNPANRATHEKQKVELRRDMERPHAEDPELTALLEKLHRPGAKIDSGSTAAAVRYERATGDLVGGVSHGQKAEDAITALSRWIDKNPTAKPGDRAAAENMFRDLLDAVKDFGK